jgi:catalase
MPEAATPARPVVEGLAVSDPLSILKNGPKSFAGRKIGVLVSDGVDADLLAALKAAAEAEGAMIELVAPKVYGVTDGSGARHPAKQKVNGGPSILYDAVALLLSKEGAKMLAEEATAREFVADAFAHAKFIGFAEAARPLLERAGVAPDEGCMALERKGSAEAFVALCRKIRHWEREPKVHAV